MAEELTVRELAKRAATVPKEQFTAELGPWVLIGPPAPLRETNEWSYSTRHAAGAQSFNPFSIVPTNMAYPLRTKDRRAMFGASILIGRTDSNDICIPDESISKLHARVTRKGFALKDAGSTNGTFVNGRRLSPSEVVRVEAKLLLRFGDRAFQVHSSEQLHQDLRNLDDPGAA